MHGERISDHLFRVAWWEMAGEGIVNADCFAIDCGEKVVLIDSGLGGISYPMLKANLSHWGLWERTSVCLLTHLHRDHAGGVAQLRTDGVSAWGGEGAAAYGQKDHRFWDYADNFPVIDHVLHDGETFTIGDLAFEVIDTPGHTSTCVTYLVTIDSVRYAFTGDLVMPNGTIGYSGSFDFDTKQLLSSLERLLSYDFDAVLTGHMLLSSQPEGFWLNDGKSHILATYRAGLDGKWKI